MRLLESIVVIATVLCSILWIIRKGTPRLKFLLTLATGIVAVVQVLVEGYRTAMLPIYVLIAGLLLYAGIRRWKPAVSPMKRRVWRRILHGLLLGCFIFSVLLAAALPALLPVFQLEKPGGPFAVGTKSFSWKYRHAEDLSADLSAEDTTLSVQFWYPAQPAHGAQTLPYATTQTLHAAAEESGSPDWMLDSLKLVNTSMVQDAPVSSKQASYPVVLFAPGERFPVLSYTGMLQELASQGFIVVSIGLVEPTLEASLVTSQESADRAVAAFWLPKISFVLDQMEHLNRDATEGGTLAGKLNFKHIGLLGHSYGGTAVPLVLQQEPRLQAGIDMDGIFYGSEQITDGVGKPFLYMDTTASRQGYSAQQLGMGAAQYQAYRAILGRRSAVLKHGGYELTIDGMLHLGFSDFDHYSPILGLFSSLDQTQADHIVRSYTAAFFRQYLEGEPSSLLAPGNQPFPQAVLRQEA